MAGTLILAANPGSASRKYALYQNEIPRGELHFEWLHGQIICTLKHGEKLQNIPVGLTDLTQAARQVVQILRTNQVLRPEENIGALGVRIVAPGAYFLQDYVVDEVFIRRLQAAQTLAPLHIGATLDELHALQGQFDVPVVGVSDSAFHSTKPDYAWNYGLPLADADHFDIKRFGYHGLSIASVLHSLEEVPNLGAKTIVCHMGSGVSVAAVQSGKSLDTTMGYSPLDGTIMATRSGSVDWTAGRVLKTALQLSDAEFELYLNTKSGLQGLGGSSDIRELLERETEDHHARLALATYVYSVQKAIGQMIAVLGGVNQFVFTGTVGERSAVMRERVIERFEYSNLVMNKQVNATCVAPNAPVNISLGAHPIPIFVVPADEARMIAAQTLQAMTR